MRFWPVTGDAPPATPTSSETEHVELAHGPTTVIWRRSARARRVTLRIDPKTSSVVITMPVRASRSTGLNLLRAHERWIEQRINALPDAPRLAVGQQLPLGGVMHTVHHRPDARRGVWIEDDRINVSGDEEFLPRRLMEFLQREAKNQLGAQISALAEKSGLRPGRLVIRDTRSRWGSCAQSGQIMLSWRLIMAPPEIQHYVIAHEMAHLRHFNHGPDFWSLVDELCPGRAHAERWLRRNGAVLMRVA